MSRNRIIVILIILVLIAVVVFYFFFDKKASEFEGESFTTGNAVPTQTFSFTGKISSVDIENNFLIVKTNNEEVKIVISETSQLIKLGRPSSLGDNPPAGTQFVPEKTEINLSDFQEGERVLVISQENVKGKNEIENVSLVQILP